MVGSTLGHYRLLERIGAGGMGVVYRAQDERLRRDVAIKVLPAEAMDDPVARARLLREARSAAALNHPNVCTIHEVGEDGGRVFIAMERVEGRALAELVGPAGMAPDTVLRHGIAIADALAHAHGRGVIHRDLKSANVMVTSEGRIKVLDFGLARRIAAAGSSTTVAASASLTEPGAMVGTPHCMAPEVLQGAEADARSDVWALGVLLHEMASGRLPFAGKTHFEIAAAIMHAPPGALPGSVPAGLREVVGRCLEKDPSRRPGGAEEVKAALEALRSDPGGGAVARSARADVRRGADRRREQRSTRLAWSGAALGLALAVALWLVNPGGVIDRLKGPSAGSLRSLAVLPLANLSGDPGQDYFADGMTDELITSLGKISALTVIARSAVMEYRGSPRPLREIAHALKVTAVLEGSVTRAEDKVRISARLIQVATGKLLWSESYERSLRDVLALQSEIARAIAEQIRVTLTPLDQARLARARPVDPAAHEAYLRGRYEWHRFTGEGFRRAIRLFEDALEVDPLFAPAYAGIADAYSQLSSGFMDVRDAMPRAKSAAERALAIDSTLSSAHAALAHIRAIHDYDWRAAEQGFQRALELNPGDLSARLNYGYLLVVNGRFEEAAVQLGRAREIDPLSPFVATMALWPLQEGRRFDVAVTEAERLLGLEPDLFPARLILGQALMQRGEQARAIAEFEAAVRQAPDPPVLLAWLGWAYGRAGRREAAEKILSRLMSPPPGQYVQPYARALVLVGLDRKDEALTELETGVRERTEEVVFLKVDPAMDPLRDTPRFAELLLRLGFER
jgi:TolB-like protein/Tfp pilus assembly protein PilF